MRSQCPQSPGRLQLPPPASLQLATPRAGAAPWRARPRPSGGPAPLPPGAGQPAGRRQCGAAGSAGTGRETHLSHVQRRPDCRPSARGVGGAMAPEARDSNRKVSGPVTGAWCAPQLVRRQGEDWAAAARPPLAEAVSAAVRGPSPPAQPPRKPGALGPGARGAGGKAQLPARALARRRRRLAAQGPRGWPQPLGVGAARKEAGPAPAGRIPAPRGGIVHPVRSALDPEARCERTRPSCGVPLLPASRADRRRRVDGARGAGRRGWPEGETRSGESSGIARGYCALQCATRFWNLDGPQAGKTPAGLPVCVSLSSSRVSTVLKFRSKTHCHTSTNTDQLPI